MSNLIKIGVLIRTILEGSQPVTEMVANKIFAIKVPEKHNREPMPHITYSRAITGRECLGNGYDTATVTVMCWAEDLDEVLELTERVCDEMEAHQFIYTGIDELYSHPAFGQQITFEYKQ